MSKNIKGVTALRIGQSITIFMVTVAMLHLATNSTLYVELGKAFCLQIVVHICFSSLSCILTKASQLAFEKKYLAFIFSIITIIIVDTIETWFCVLVNNMFNIPYYGAGHIICYMIIVWLSTIPFLIMIEVSDKD